MTVKTSDLTWLADVREFVGEASDIGMKAFPQEFTLHSTGSGKRVQCEAVCEKRDNEGDLLYVVYGDHSFGGAPFTVRIFND